MKKNFMLGIDLGGTKTALGIVNQQGKIISQFKENTLIKEGASGIIKQMINLSELAIRKANIKNIQKEIIGIGIAAAGPLNSKTGVLVLPPNLPGWYNVQLTKPFEKYFKLPAYLLNDGNAACLGEWMFGAAKGKKNVVYFTVSTGIGGGAIIDNKLFLGANDNAAELGHMTLNPKGPKCGCGSNGCLESYASGTSIAKKAQLILKDKTLSAKDVLYLAKNGNIKAKKIIVNAFTYLGIGVANAVTSFNPEIVVLGGGVSKAKNMMLKIVKQEVKKRVMSPLLIPLKIVPAKNIDSCGILGAAAYVLYKNKKLKNVF